MTAPAGTSARPESQSWVRVRRIAHVPAVSVIIAVATALALALRLYQLTRPGLLLGTPQYDDGEYLGSAIRLADGVLPYRDFVFVQPPGISVLMAPLGLLAKLTGTATAMVVARFLTVAAGAAAVTLAGLIARTRGALAVAIVCGVLAVHPDAVGAASTLFLEPWVVLFCLMGWLAAFDGERVTNSRRRLVWAGVAFGFAGAIKVWAIFPVLVLAALLVYRAPRRRAAEYLAGVAGGFCATVGPFVAIAPRAFYDDVILAQLHRTDVTRVPAVIRLDSLFGLSDHLSPSDQTVVLASLAIGTSILACFIGASLISRRLPSALDWFAVGAGVVTLAAFKLPTDYYPHYAAFFAPFLAMAFGLEIAALANSVTARSAATPRARRAQAALKPALMMAAIALVGWMAITRFGQEKSLRAVTASAAVKRAIPAGACVLTDESSFTILANRFLADAPDCPQMVDSIATDMGLSGGKNALTGAGRYPAVQAAWLGAFRHAQYVWLNCGPPRARGCDRFTNRRIPWTQPIVRYFTRNFRYLPSVGVYVRRGSADSAVSRGGQLRTLRAHAPGWVN